MKTANVQIADRDQRLEKLNNRLEVLENFYEENQQIIADEKKKNEVAMENYRKSVIYQLDEAK